MDTTEPTMAASRALATRLRAEELSPTMVAALLSATVIAPDVMYVTRNTPNARADTVLALMGRNLLLPVHAQPELRRHLLTSRGRDVYRYLAQVQAAVPVPQVADEPPEPLTQLQKERAGCAVRAARFAHRTAHEDGHPSRALSEAVAAALESVASEGGTSPESLQAIARAVRAR